MSKKPKPRWGWIREWNQDDLRTRLARIDFRRMAAAVGVKDDAALSRFERDYDSSLGMYHFVLEQRSNPSRPEIKSALKAVKKRAIPLLEVVEQLDEISRMFLGYGLTVHSKPPPHSEQGHDGKPIDSNKAAVERTKLIESLQTLIAAVDTTLGIMPTTKPGRKTNEPLNHLIWGLAELYEDQTGTPADAKSFYDPERREYGGPFFLFLEETLAAFAPEETISNNALGEAIRRALGKR